LQFDNETRSLRPRLISQVAAERSYERAGQIEPKTRRFGLRLKRPKKQVGTGHTATGIFKSDRDTLLFEANPHRELAAGAVAHCTSAVLD
jgi:hypothetical protein